MRRFRRAVGGDIYLQSGREPAARIYFRERVLPPTFHASHEHPFLLSQRGQRREVATRETAHLYEWVWAWSQHWPRQGVVRVDLDAPDIDLATVARMVETRGYPAPSYVLQNPVSLNLQPGYNLRWLIDRAKPGNAALLRGRHLALTQLWGGDMNARNCAAMRNPLCDHAYSVVWFRSAPWEIPELGEWLARCDIDADAHEYGSGSPLDVPDGVSRNCDLFRVLSSWARRPDTLALMRRLPRIEWTALVHAHTERLNAQLTAQGRPAMDASVCRHIAKSVSHNVRWWYAERPPKSRYASMGGRARAKAIKEANAERDAAIEALRDQGHTEQAIADEIGLSRGSVHRALRAKNAKARDQLARKVRAMHGSGESKRAIAIKLGVSRNTVTRLLRGTGLPHPTVVTPPGHGVPPS